MSGANSTEPNSPAESTIGAKTMSAGAVTAVSQLLTTMINTVGTVVVARILSPADFGLLAKVAAVTGIVNVLGDLGLSAATIQRKDISQEQLSMLFWINVAGGTLIALGIALLSPLLAYFYDDPRVVYVGLGYAISTFLGGFSPQHMAILKRRLRFGQIAVTDVTAAVLSVLVAIFSAPYVGYFALLLQIVAIKIVSVVGSWFFSAWMPGKPQRKSGSMALIKMGSHLTGASVVNYFARNADNLLIAKVWGEESLGLYSRAYGLLLLPLQRISVPMSSVAVPALSRLQTSPERFREFFVRGCSIAMVLQVPITVFAGISGREIILAMLGPAWVGAVPIFYALTPALIMSSTSPATGWIYRSWGHTDRQFKMTALTSLLIVLGFAIAVPFGPVWVAASFSLISGGIRIPAISYCFRGTPIRPLDFWKTMVSPAIAAIVAATPTLAVAWAWPSQNPFVTLLVKASVFGVVYAAVLYPTNAGQSFLKDLLRVVRNRNPARFTATAEVAKPS